MNRSFNRTNAIEPLEPRCLLSAVPATSADRAGDESAADAAQLAPGQPAGAARLSANNVRTILAQAASQASAGQAIVVVDRQGFILGIFGMSNTKARFIQKAAARARTAAFFQSRDEAFTTRTARFIIQDRFPHPVPNTPGGPLYGVQFSSLPGGDVLSDAQTPAISGDPGGIPLYKGGAPVGGIGVAGDGRDVAVREDARTKRDPDNPKRLFFNGQEERDRDEAVALAGARGFMAPEGIQATQVFLDGLRLPFTADKPASNDPDRTLDEIIAAGDGALRRSVPLGRLTKDVVASQPESVPQATFAGIDGQIMNPIIDSDDGQAVKLSQQDVRRIIADAMRKASRVRAAIRLPIGTNATVHVAVVDRDGDLLGVFRMDDGTRFSYDVAVQKARTAAFFSDNRHAFSTRAIGFMSQGFFPPGIENARNGPLFGLQNALSTPANFKGRLENGITIFPGGVPLYKDGKFVGAVGVSGDGVDQDDIIAYAGSKRFRPKSRIRSDALSESQTVNFLLDRLDVLEQKFALSPDLLARIRTDLLGKGISGVHLPYVKFPRNPDRDE
jgi:uncharacterized protein GlcG (DUF336 family)